MGDDNDETCPSHLCSSTTMTGDRKLLKWCFLFNLFTLIVGVAFLIFQPKQADELMSSVDVFLQTGQVTEDMKARIHNAWLSETTTPLISSDHTTSDNNIKATTYNATTPDGGLRILYIITSLAEYNSGKRATEKGSDRLQETLIPVMREAVLSMLDFGYQVDVFLVCHWEVQPDRLELIRRALPPQVGLDYWDDATPLGYKLESKGDTHIELVTRALARQHRFVVKDKFLEYDFFACFEDDMLINGHLVKHNLMVSTELARLEKLAPEYHTEYNATRVGTRDLERKYLGELTKSQLRRMFPGLIRVEVLLDEENYPTQKSTGPIPVDLDFGNNASAQINPEYCCHVRPETASPKMPMQPEANKLFLWESSILALGVHKMPEESTLDWVLFQRGPNTGGSDPEEILGDYWAGRNGEFKKEQRPAPTKGMYLNNMGGWMASRQQIWNWHMNVCQGGFLPPYDSPHYNMDGKDLRNVEYWSGGLHLFTRRNACNMQRIITMDPEGFSKHLIYHTANNKQRQLFPKREKCFNKATTLLGQLNSVRKTAERDHLNEKQKKKK